MLVVTRRCGRRKPAYNGLGAHFHSGVAVSRLRSTAAGGLALTLTARCDTSFHVAGYHAPHKAGEFPCDSCFSDIGSLVVFENHAIVFPPQSLVRFICIGDDLRSVAILTSLECLGLETDLSSTVTLGCFYQQAAHMAVSGLGNAQTVLIVATGIFTWCESDVGSKVLGRCKALEIPVFCKYSQCSYGLNANETGQLMDILLM